MQPGMTTEITEFRRWRDEMGFSQAEAAEALGLSLSHVKNYDAGRDRGAGGVSVPSLATRTLMSVLAEGVEIEPWPVAARVKGKRRV